MVADDNSTPELVSATWAGSVNRSDDIETVYLALTTMVRRSQQLGGKIHPSLSLPAYTVLNQVGAEPGTRARDLVEYFGLDKSTVSRQVNQLETAGLLRRAGERPGRRGSVLEVTAEGQRLLDQAGGAIRSALADRMVGWDDGDIARFATLLEAFNRTRPTSVPGRSRPVVTGITGSTRLSTGSLAGRFPPGRKG
jgi:DNA-binding MarR family transcriptional regulator